ncbi:hypothetical protein [Thermomonospora umbrina]|uniref:Uncharacterized protein n=1 Tax=Thermomonospora umbrina TaxID=111806 RepID=A0A3D9SX64_9ACTN|nr:hypothetical protein [Thermomonospora umbrina]REF00550.1 hypothetical protein DFJ69_6099 [Thermomonospora umbrina]
MPTMGAIVPLAGNLTDDPVVEFADVPHEFAFSDGAVRSNPSVDVLNERVRVLGFGAGA